MMEAITSAGTWLHGAITAQVSVGRYALHIGGPHGAVVCESPAARRVHALPRATPVVVRPRSMRGLFGRQAELDAIFSALASGLPVEISGRPGIGKTALLRSLAYHPSAASFPDGIVYVTARHQSSADLQQYIFSAFYESDEIRKPTAADIRGALQDKRVLILADDVQMKREELEQLLDAAPRSAFVVATREQRLYSEVRHLTLDGLAVDDAVQLLEREIAHPLEEGERQAAANICTALHGHPHRILLAAALLRERRSFFDAWANGISPETVMIESLGSIDQKQRRILLVLAAMRGVPIPAAHIAGIAELPDVESSLAGLVHRALVVATQAGHRLADGVGDRLRRTEDVNPSINRAITYYTAWAERYRRDVHALLDESEALRRVQLHASNVRRWGEALRLGRILEGALVVGVRWDAWATVLEQCLLAAKATEDRAAEAWTLHQIGSRALCVGETRGARSTLSEALKLRESLGDTDGTSTTRQNLSFVLVPDVETPRVPAAADDAFEFSEEPLHIQSESPSQLHADRLPLADALAIAAIVLMLVGGVAYWFAGQPDLRSLNVTAFTSFFAHAETPSSTVASAEPAVRAWSEATVQNVGAKAPAQTPSILIFSPRPGSYGPTKLCYAVVGAVRAVVEPGIGDVTPTDRLTCLRVAPPRTTTYQLTALGRDGDQVRQQLVVVVR
jgi:hypothetical protein